MQTLIACNRQVSSLHYNYFPRQFWANFSYYSEYSFDFFLYQALLSSLLLRGKIGDSKNSFLEKEG